MSNSTPLISVSRKDKIISMIEHSSEIDNSILISSSYDSKKKIAVLKFYSPETQRIMFWHDTTGHKPYCYTKVALDEIKYLENRSDIIKISQELKTDLITDTEINVTKIVAEDPLAIGGTSNSKSVRNIVDCWEADIKYYETFLYDQGLTVGAFYNVQNSIITPSRSELSSSILNTLNEIIDKNDPDLSSRMFEWAELLNQPIPNLKRISLDIEVYSTEDNRIPTPQEAQYPIVAAAMVGSNDLSEVLILKRDDVPLNRDQFDQKGVDFKLFDDESSLIGAILDRILEYPFLLTFNGDNFDLNYLYHRALNLGYSHDDIPITLGRDVAFLKHGVHIDLYKTFNNRSMQIYAFSGKYIEHTLNGVSSGLLGENKVEFDGPLRSLSLGELAKYCFKDADITYRLTSFSDDLLMRLLLVVTRISKMPIDDVSRFGVSNWIKSLMYFEHRKINALIPRRDELSSKGGSNSSAVIKGKKYKGGIVVEPNAGIHFNVSVLDFASLYPSIMKVQNLSYETVDCPHSTCSDNNIPETNHWKCATKRGMSSLVIGSLRDLRVNYYKRLGKDPSLTTEQRELYSVISQALKVILNASYGVMGAELYPLYCLPVADATASVGRYMITKTIDYCNELGITVLYGDTDSLFLQGITSEQLQNITKWSHDSLRVDLDLDKVYRYVVFSQRKKNYLGILEDGSFEIKGLTGKKSHIPPFIKNTFYDTVGILSKVQSKDEFENARVGIKQVIKDKVSKLKKKEIPMDELAFNVMLSKSPENYIDTIPQHVKAAKLLKDKLGKEVKAGDIISYVKTSTPPGVKPVTLATLNEIDVKKYLDHLESTFDQLLDSIGYDFDEILGATKLEDFFWSDN